jgi:hypothetical protein
VFAGLGEHLNVVLVGEALNCLPDVPPGDAGGVGEIGGSRRGTVLEFVDDGGLCLGRKPLAVCNGSPTRSCWARSLPLTVFALAVVLFVVL